MTRKKAGPIGTSIRLSAEHVALLDKLRKKTLTSRTEVIRRAIVEMAERMGK